MSGTLQHPENCAGPKAAAETACAWAPSAAPRIIYRSEPMQSAATQWWESAEIRKVPQAGTSCTGLLWGTGQGHVLEAPALQENRLWWAPGMTQAGADAPHAPQAAVPGERGAAQGTGNGASHGNWHPKHGRAAHPLDLFRTTDLPWKYSSARIFCEQQPKESRIFPSLR